MSEPDWSRKLSRPVDLGGKPLRTLGDVRDHLMRLPAEREHWRPVQYVAGLLLEVANGKDVDITVPLRMVRQAFLLPQNAKRARPGRSQGGT